MYNLTEQQVRKLIGNAWDCCEAFHFQYASNNKEKHTAYELSTLQQSAPASSVGEIIWTAVFKDEQSFIDFLKWQKLNQRVEEAPKEDEI